MIDKTSARQIAERLSNQIANAILALRGPGPEAVALLTALHAPSVAAALGVMKAGKFYVAIEESLPRQRVVDILEDSGSELILSDSEHLIAALDLARDGRQALDFEDLPAAGADPPGIKIALDDVAMLLYTSGSTGRPKGVVYSHRFALSKNVRWYSIFHICAADRLANFTALAWSASTRFRDSGFWGNGRAYLTGDLGRFLPDCTLQHLVEIWEEVLGIKGIGVDDNFIELGGESLQSTRIINRVNESLAVNISYVAFFEALTISEMAAVIAAG